MNIYLDIDGVLLINESNLAPHADEFLQYVINTFPESTYWLTTHVWKGENRINQVLAPLLSEETKILLPKVKTTEWGELKTDAINFDEKFLWFDDDLWPDELKALEDHKATDSFIMVDLTKHPNQLKDFIGR